MTETTETTSFALIILQKHNVSLLFWVHTNERIRIRKIYYFYLYEQRLRSILRASESTGAYLSCCERAAVQFAHTLQ